MGKISELFFEGLTSDTEKKQRVKELTKNFIFLRGEAGAFTSPALFEVIKILGFCSTSPYRRFFNGLEGINEDIVIYAATVLYHGLMAYSTGNKELNDSSSYFNFKNYAGMY